MKSKKDDPPRLIAVLSSQGALQNIYIVGAGQELDTQTCLFRDGLLKLHYAYYDWDLSYLKFFQLLGFILDHVLEDKKNPQVLYFKQLSKFYKRLNSCNMDNLVI